MAIANQNTALSQLRVWNASSKESPKKSTNTAKLLLSLRFFIFLLLRILPTLCPKTGLRVRLSKGHTAHILCDFLAPG